MERSANRNRALNFESLEARRVLSCDFTMDGVCDADDLDAMYRARGTLAGRGTLQVDYRFGSDLSNTVTAEVTLIHPAAVAENPAFEDGLVFDLYMNTTTDLLLFDATIDLFGGQLHNDTETVGVYGNLLGKDTGPLPPLALERFPALHADSWVRTSAVSNSTIVGDFESGTPFTVFDSNNDGMQDGLHFARLVVLQSNNQPINGRLEVTAQLKGPIAPRFFEFSVELGATTIRSRFGYDADPIVDGRDIPGWLASASALNPEEVYRMGDTNLDGNVDSGDLSRLLNNFTRDEGVGWLQGDLNMDRVVDSEDLGILLANFGFQSEANYASVSQAAQSIDAFAGDLYEQLQSEGGNVVFSPLSIASALTMVYSGANGLTATEMENVLHLEPGSSIHESYRNLLNGFAATPVPTEIEVANAIWPSAEIPLAEDFVSNVSANYGATAQNLDYSDPAAAEGIINAWVEETTNGRISDLVDGLSSSTAMVLTNSVYFKSLWSIPFDPALTSEGSFKTSEGATVTTPIMKSIEVPGVRTTEMGGFKVLELPFRGRSTSMVVAIPLLSTVDTDLSSETFAGINQWVDEANEEFDPLVCTSIHLPKFTTTVATDLTDLLPAMGMPTAFGGGADFSGMFADAGASISDVRHEAFLEVNESGAEAAASSSVELILCFAKGTNVLTPSGLQPIETIEVGDYVLARDEKDPEGALHPKQVEELFGGQKAVLRLRIAGQIIESTSAHPFYEKDKGWTAAGDLQAGDLLSTSEGAWVAVEEVVVGNRVDVFNFRVADFHTYFVGDEECKIWVHNCYVTEAVDVNRAFHFLIRDNVNDATVFMGRISDPTQMQNELSPLGAAANIDSVSLPIADVSQQSRSYESVIDESVLDELMTRPKLDFAESSGADVDSAGGQLECVSPGESFEAFEYALAKLRIAAVGENLLEDEAEAFSPISDLAGSIQLDPEFQRFGGRE